MPMRILGRGVGVGVGVVLVVVVSVDAHGPNKHVMDLALRPMSSKLWFMT